MGVPRKIPKSNEDWKKLFDGIDGIKDKGVIVGAVAAGTGVTASSGITGFNQTVLTFVNAPLALIDTPGVVARCALKILDFPEGQIQIVGATANLTFGKSSAGVIDAWDGDFALGTVAAAGDATLTSTEANVIPTTSTPQAVAGNTTGKGVSTASLLVDGTATAVDLYLNVLVDDTDQDVTTTPANIIANGTITVLWANMGDK